MFPIAPLAKLPSNASATDKNILAPKIRELIDAANALDQRLAGLESIPAPVPAPTPTPTPTAMSVTLTATRDIISAALYPTGHWTQVTAVVHDAAGVVQTTTLANLEWSMAGDTTAVTVERNAPDKFEVNSPTRDGQVIVTARWVPTGATASYPITLVGPVVAAPAPTTTPAPAPVVIDITAAQLNAIMAVPLGGLFTLREPVSGSTINCQVTG